MAIDASKRSYDASRRRAHARRVQVRILTIARRQFLTNGYATTSISSIAAEAEASPESIYKSFGGKSRLLKAVFDAELAGPGAESSDMAARRLSVQERSAEERLRAFGTIVAEIGPRVAPLALLVRDGAVGDRELAQLWAQLNRERLERMSGHAQRLADDGHLRPGVTVDEARDILWAFASPELYDLLVRRQSWDVDRFGQWVGESYVKALLS